MNRFKQETFRTQHNIQSYDYWTPPEIFTALDMEFDLDAASPVGGVDWIPAKWLDKFIEHRNGIALVFSRTDTKWFHDYVKKSDAVLFIKGRLFFYKSGIKTKHSAGNGSILIACGEKSVNALEKSGLGWFIKL